MPISRRLGSGGGASTDDANEWTATQTFTAPVIIKTNDVDRLKVTDASNNVFLLEDGNNLSVRNAILDTPSTGGIVNIQMSSGRLIIGPSGTLEIRASSGGSVDARLYRSAASVITLDNGSGGAAAFVATGTITPGVYTVAGLPAAGTAGRVAFASNGRKNGEGAASGTGVLVFDDGTAWRACDTGATVAA